MRIWVDPGLQRGKLRLRLQLSKEAAWRQSVMIRASVPSELSRGRLIDRAVARGLDFLERSDGARLICRERGRCSGVRSPFGAALVASALATSGCRHAHRVIGPLIDYLCRTREASGWWHFSRRMFPTLPADVDDTACSLTALLWSAGSDLEARLLRDARRTLDSLGQYRRREGAFLTWLTRGDTSDLPEGGNDVDIVVNVNVLTLAETIGRRDQAVENEVLGRLAVHGLTCSRGSFYYTSPFMLSYFLGRWLRLPSAKHLAPWAAHVEAACVARLGATRSAPFEMALALSSLLDTRPRQRNLLGLVDGLLETQRSDGSWHEHPAFLGPQGMSFGSAALTTAFAVESLAVYSRFRRGLGRPGGLAPSEQ